MRNKLPNTFGCKTATGKLGQEKKTAPIFTVQDCCVVSHVGIHVFDWSISSNNFQADVKGIIS